MSGYPDIFTKTILIVGGTGTLGTELIKQLSDKNFNRIICFSRDELKQQKLKKKYPEVKFIIGDIKDEKSIDNAIIKTNPDVIYHVAALKHIDVIEENVLEGFKTNIIGLVNCAESAIRNKVSNFVFSSTDKAVLPINAYGFQKALGEKYLLSLKSTTKFSIFRWGNIIGSRGSVIHTFAKTLKEEEKIYLTDERMTRFWLPIHEAVSFMIKNYEMSEGIMIPDCKTYPVFKIAKAVAKVLNLPFNMEIVGLRGPNENTEKLHECLYSSHQNCITSDRAPEWDEKEIINEIKHALFEAVHD